MQLTNRIRTSMPFFSSLFSSVNVADRVASLKEAEGRLFDFARTRFAHGQEESNHFELFDTPINVPSVIKDASCQVHGSSADAVAENGYSLHGVEVTNRRLSSLAEGGSAASTAKQPAPLVLLHGYANGSLYFYRNLMGLSHYFGSIYALDLLGWGLSSRPKFELIAGDEGGDIEIDKSLSKEDKAILKTKQKVSSAESFFVESLESWRKQHDLPKLTLAGHSMGGYLSVAYAERYPEHVERLILLSPVGVPEKQAEDERKIDHLPFYVRGMIKTVRYLFNKGVTPGAFLRSLPHSKSKQMVDGYITNRLPAISCPEEQEHLSEYLYQNSMLPGSGEMCLGEILTAGAFAKVPLVDRIPEIKTKEVHFIYGQNDWMDFKGGLDTQRLCHQKQLEWEKQQSSGAGDAGSSSSPPPKIFVHGVKDASHLLMLDNYKEFNAAVIIASGGEKNLPPNAPRPMELVCDEVARSGASHHGRRHSVGEDGAKAFFRGPRWNRGQESEAPELDDGSEEKKMEEQLA
ncbi:hypothetical protein ACHAXT_001736 [Thalassiosira profunda]